MQQDELMKQLLEVFRDEAREHLQNAGRMLVELEKLPAAAVNRGELLAEAFRAMHSLKGASRVVNFLPVAETAHRVESVLNAARSGDFALESAHYDALLRALDEIERLVNEELADGKTHDVTALHAELDALLSGPSPAAAPPASEGMSAPVGGLAPEEAARELREVIDESSSDAATTLSDVARPAEAGGPADETIRVASSKLDALLAQTGELLTTKIGVDQRAKELKALVADARSVLSALRRAPATAGAVAPFVDGTTTGVLEAVATLTERLDAVATDLVGDRTRIGLVTTELQDQIRYLRMLPMGALFEALPRLARDVARRAGKKVEIRMSGTEIEVDKRILEGIKDPLFHLVSNAIDHGIEAPARRSASGKPEVATIEVSARMRGNDVVVAVRDDGGGLDIERIKELAVSRGVIRAEQLGDFDWKDQLNLIFRSGFSTATEVTDISGRGVGLDVVRENSERLGGRVDVETELGKGTVFRLILPLSVATAEGLLIEVAGQTVALPITSVQRILRIRRRELKWVHGKAAIVVDDEPVAVTRLDSLLELPHSEREVPDVFPVVLMGSASRRLALVVDEVKGHQEMVVKSLGKQLARVRNIVGATVLGSGQVVVVLNPVDLLRSATGDRRAHSVSARAVEREDQNRRRILVADDSITTRNVERMTLEAAGYFVKTAPDGLQAWRLLEEEQFDLVLTDLNMPHMNGLELIRRIKAGARTKTIPVVLVTSMGAPEDMARGLEAGADAHIVKSAFDRDTILTAVRRLL